MGSDEKWLECNTNHRLLVVPNLFQHERVPNWVVKPRVALQDWPNPIVVGCNKSHAQNGQVSAVFDPPGDRVGDGRPQQSPGRF